jgi:4'-phosphopantetheinyl transferase
MTRPTVDVFWADLETAMAMLPQWERLLSADENERAGRFRFRRDRHRYIARHGILRWLLAWQLDVAPDALRFTVNAYGKPALDGHTLDFNLSHSHGMALFAFSREIAVGCDIEFHDLRFLAENIPERVFSPAELNVLNACTASEKIRAFFDCWTRKEAYIKARGVGLSLPLDSFDVSLAPVEQPALMRGCEGWSAHCVAPGRRYSAAIIAESTDWQINAQAVDVTALPTRTLAA